MKTIFLLLTLFAIIAFAETNVLAQKTDEGNSLRILTFNILHGATMKGDFDLDKIAAVIKDADADFVALQEVDYKTRRAKNYDLVTELGWRTKMAPLFGRAMDYDGGAYGEGILTRLPISSSRNVPLPHSPGNEPRAALEVTVKLESGEMISFIGTHLEHQQASSDRIDQAEEINKVFNSNKYPTILAGDLNDTPESEPIRILRKYWTDVAGENAQPTFPSNGPVKKIDYILFRPADRWEVIENKVICDTVASDHCAVLTVLKLKAK